MYVYVAIIAVLMPVMGFAQELCVTTYNIESSGSQIPALVKVVARHSDCDLWVFQEVESPEVIYHLEAALEKESGRKMHFILGSSGWGTYRGGPDSIAIIYDMERMSLEHTQDVYKGYTRRVLKARKSYRQYRSILIARFKLILENIDFELVGTHLASKDENFNTEQSKLLSQMPQQVKIPLIAAGDFNYRYAIKSNSVRPGYKELKKTWQWAKPKKLFRTACNSATGKVYKPAILDFIFTANAASKWQYSAEILETEDGENCFDNNYRSDHRPVRAIFTVQ